MNNHQQFTMSRYEVWGWLVAAGLVGLLLWVTPSRANDAPPAPGDAGWHQVVVAAREISAEQNGGQFIKQRACQPDLKVCSTWIPYLNKDGEINVVRETENLNGDTIEREICMLNKTRDIRICKNWDTLAVHQDMLKPDGTWVVVK